ncbi:AAA family ATPase [Streptomyces violascens]|uniref:AAA family ATPase n=1 Tax=Streptomyces violascens TaxID=67381 RepID=UPI003667D844
MRISVSGTYSAGKTFTSTALSYYTGIPRSPARTIREIMPEALPGKSLADVTPPEYVQLAVRRHVGRAVNEALLGDNFISDGSSLQEWTYAALRAKYGMNPSATVDVDQVTTSPEMLFFAEVTAQLGQAFKQHVKETFDVYVHLQNEFPLSADGHRPMNERFRSSCDELLLATLDDLSIPYHVIGGSVPERLEKIVAALDLPVVRSIDESIELSRADYAKVDWRLEEERTAS